MSDEGLRVPSMTLPSISMTIISSSTIFSYIMPDGVTRISPVGHAHAQVATGQRYQLIAVEQDTGFDDFFFISENMVNSS